MSRDNTPIWKDYNAMVDAHVYIKKNGEWVDTGRHFTAMPGQAIPSCYINRIAEDYVKSKQPSFDVMAANSAYTETQPDAYQVFKTDAEEDEYGAYNDWSYEERSDSGHCQNAPINSHADARQILTYGRWGVSGDSITVKEMLQPIVKATPFLLHLGAEQTYGQFITIESNKVGELILPAWLMASETAISVGTNSIYVAPSENTGWDNREGNIIVKCEGYDTDYAYIPVVYVNQAGIVPYFNVSPAEQSVDWQSGMTYFLVNTNVSYSAATSQSWLIYSGSTPAAPHNYNAFFTVTANTGDDRQASVTFTYQTSESTTATKTVAVRQRHVPDLSISPTSKDIDAKSQSVRIVVTSEVPWYLLSKPEWISAPTSGVSGVSLVFLDVEFNPTEQDRSGIVEFSNGFRLAEITVAQERTYGIIKYRTSDGNVLYPNVTSGYSWNFVESNYVDGLGTMLFDGNVTAIPAEAFSGLTRLTEIQLPATVTSIGDNSFSGCTSLGAINTTSAITSVGNFAFRGCSALSSVTLAEGLQTLGAASFYDCTSLSAITIPSTVRSFGQSAFQNCSALSSVTVSSGVTNIGNSAFYNCTAISSITLPDSVTSISTRAFYGCTALTSITIPASITSIGENAFVSSLYLNVFYQGTYTQWQNITLGSTYIAQSATIHYKYNTKTQANYVAYQTISSSSSHFLNLGIPLSTDIKIAGRCRSAGITTGSILLGCPYNTTENNDFKFYQGNTTGSTFDWGSQRIGGDIGLRIADSGSTLNFTLGNYTITNDSSYRQGSYSSAATGTTQTTVPPSGTVIAINTNRWWIEAIKMWKGDTLVLNAYAALCDDVAGFYDSVSDTFLTISGLTAVVQPCNEIWYTTTGNTVLTPYSAGTSVFGANIISNTYENGQGIITFDNCVTSIGNSAFYYKRELSTISLPYSVRSIGQEAFARCSNFSSIRMPEGVANIGSNAFNMCYAMPMIEIPGSVQTIATQAFMGNCFKTVIINDGVRTIGEQAFQASYNLLSIDIPDSVTTIGQYAFQSCGSLKTAIIGSGVTTFGKSVFASCTSLLAAAIKQGARSIGNTTFNGCTALSAVTLGCLYIGESAFTGCTALKLVTMEEGVKAIGASAFSGCTALTSITMPDSVTTIGTHAFQHCSALKSASMGSGITTIETYAFAYSKISTMNYNNTIANWNMVSKGNYWKASIPATVVHCTDGDTPI